VQDSSDFYAEATWSVQLLPDDAAQHEVVVKLFCLPTSAAAGPPLVYYIDWEAPSDCRDWVPKLNGRDINPIPGPARDSNRFSIDLTYYLQNVERSPSDELSIAFKEVGAWESRGGGYACYEPRVWPNVFPRAGLIGTQISCKALCPGLRKLARWLRERVPGHYGRAIFVGKRPHDEDTCRRRDVYAYHHIKSGAPWGLAILYDRRYNPVPWLASLAVAIGASIAGTAIVMVYNS
jgi:hypothetical protein